MTDMTTTPATSKDRDRQLWASGSYARIAELVVPLAEDLVGLAGIIPGESWTSGAGRGTPPSPPRWPAGA